MAFNIEKYIRDVKDFPNPGIIFKDITPLLADAQALHNTTQALLEVVPSQIDKVVGIEARGFFFGTLLADRLNAGFVPIRKPGKLPYETYTETYQLEYGTDSLSMHVDAIKPGDKVLLHDDVLATGGTAAAAVKLIEKAGGEIVQLSFLIDLGFPEAHKKLKNYDISYIMTYL